MIVPLATVSALALLPLTAASMDKVDTGRKIGYVILIILGFSVVLAVLLALWRRADLTTEWRRRRMRRPVLPVDTGENRTGQGIRQTPQYRPPKNFLPLPHLQPPPPAYSIDPTPKYTR